jgi:hypothetical protein
VLCTTAQECVCIVVRVAHVVFKSAAPPGTKICFAPVPTSRVLLWQLETNTSGVIAVHTSPPRTAFRVAAPVHGTLSGGCEAATIVLWHHVRDQFRGGRRLCNWLPDIKIPPGSVLRHDGFSFGTELMGTTVSRDGTRKREHERERGMLLLLEHTRMLTPTQ